MNQLNNKPKFSLAIQSDGYKRLINNTLGDPKRSAKFIAGITSAVATNQALQECDAGSILSGALLGEALNLSPSPQLGQYYLVPYEKKEQDPTTGQWKTTKYAQFQLGYKGYIQLAIRSGQYKKLNVLAIKEGELISYDALNEEIDVKLIDDEEERENAVTIGYYAMFEYTNGFRKTLYWSKNKMKKHAMQYSQSYMKDIKKGTSYSFWSKDFDGMAFKTMLRQLISKWGIMSVEMQEALSKDMAVIKEDGSYDYVDNAPVTEPKQVVEHPVEEPIQEQPPIQTTATNIEPKKVNINEL